MHENDIGQLPVQFSSNEGHGAISQTFDITVSDDAEHRSDARRHNSQDHRSMEIDSILRESRIGVDAGGFVGGCWEGLIEED